MRPFCHELLREGSREDLATFISDHALARALLTYDASRGTFENWLRWKIGREIQRVRQQCRDDRRSETTDDFACAVDHSDKFGATDDRLDVVAAVRRALEALPENDHRFFLGFVQAHHNDPRRFLDVAAELLGESRDEVQRAWDRIKYRLPRAFPGGLPELGI